MRRDLSAPWPTLSSHQPIDGFGGDQWKRPHRTRAQERVVGSDVRRAERRVCDQLLSKASEKTRASPYTAISQLHRLANSGYMAMVGRALDARDARPRGARSAKLFGWPARCA